MDGFTDNRVEEQQYATIHLVCFSPIEVTLRVSKCNKKMNISHLLALTSSHTYMSFFCGTYYAGNQTVLVPFDFHSTSKIQWKSNGTKTEPEKR